MKILVLGNINSKWVKEYIEYVLLPLGHNVEVLGNGITCKYTAFYQSNGVTIHDEKSAGRLVRKIPFVRVLSSVSHIVKENHWNDYDVIINLFVNHRNLRITRKVMSPKTKTVVYYAGSDLLRTSKVKILLNRMIIPNPDALVVGSMTLAADIGRKYPENTAFEVIHFGISAFENIAKFQKEHPNIRRKNTFCIGYSGVPQHNHLEVLEVFNKLPSELKQKAFLVVPMTYEASAEYIAQVRKKLDEVGIPYEQPTEFMDNDAMARMWSGISFFINAQTTDSLSASVLEAMYAGAVLVNASWLAYPEYKAFGVKSISFENYDQLYGTIVDILEKKVDFTDLVCSDTLNQHMSWNAARDAWAELFSRIERS